MIKDNPCQAEDSHLLLSYRVRATQISQPYLVQVSSLRGQGRLPFGASFANTANTVFFEYGTVPCMYYAHILVRGRSTDGYAAEPRYSLHAC